MLAILLLLSLAGTLFLLIKQRNAGRLLNCAEIIEDMWAHIQPSQGLERNLDRLLSGIAPLIKAQGFAFYIQDEKKGQYLMRAIHYASDIPNDPIGPAYSGLLPYQRESYHPPLSIAADSVPTKTYLAMDRDVPVLVLPVSGGVGLIHIWPIRKIDGQLRQMFDQIGIKLQYMLPILMEVDRLKDQVAMVVASGAAMKNISNLLHQEMDLINVLMTLCVRTIEANGGFFIEDRGNGSRIQTGMDPASAERLFADEEAWTVFTSLLGSKTIVSVERGEKEFFALPLALAAPQIQKVMLINVHSGKAHGVAGFWFSQIAEIDPLRLDTLAMLARRIGEVMLSCSRINKISQSYIEPLKLLTQMIDALNPCTVGYADLMAHYAMIVGLELKLDADEIRGIVLAAYLSNIGILGLFGDLFAKRDRYTELEYEMMKLHSTVGAMIIESTLGDHRVAEYIKHHHERMDGLGYPDRLRGDEIPLGSQVIAMLQVFLAKIRPREGRQSIPFSEALQQLESASGTQLNPVVVRALIQWFQRKWGEIPDKNRSLGPCWEMRCSSLEICHNCPAFMKHEKNCWEQTGVLCNAHGDQCETCFVHTEFTTRPATAVPSPMPSAE